MGFPVHSSHQSIMILAAIHLQDMTTVLIIFFMEGLASATLDLHSYSFYLRGDKDPVLSLRKTSMRRLPEHHLGGSGADVFRATL